MGSVFVAGLSMEYSCAFYSKMIGPSYLLEGGNIDGLDFVFPSKDLVEEIIGEDLVVFNGATHLDLLHAESDFDKLVFSSPHKTVHFDLEDSLGELVKILFLFEDFNIEDNDGLGNNLLLGLLGFFGLLLLHFFELLGFFFVVTAEEIIIIVVLLGGGRGLLGDMLQKVLGKDGTVGEPEVKVGVLFFIGGLLVEGQEDLSIVGVGVGTAGKILVVGEVSLDFSELGFVVDGEFAHGSECDDF